jgi:hypothetical protein
MMAFKHAFTVISTNFDLEPVLEEYLKTYPEGDLQNYRIVFKTEGEHHPESRSYIIVYEHKPGSKSRPHVGDFLKSYCTVHNLSAVANPLNHVFPDISGRHGHVLSRYKEAK